MDVTALVTNLKLSLHYVEPEQSAKVVKAKAVNVKPLKPTNEAPAWTELQDFPHATVCK